MNRNRKYSSYKDPYNQNNIYQEERFEDWLCGIFGIKVPSDQRGCLFTFLIILLLPTPIFWILFIYYLIRKDFIKRR